MTEKKKEQEGALSPQEMKDFAGQWAEFFSGLQQVLAENELLRQQVLEMKEKDVKREAQLQEEKECNTKLEMQLTEMGKMTASVAGKAIAIPSATLLSKRDKDILRHLEDKHSEHLGDSPRVRFHMWPDNDVPGERLFLQLQEVLPSLVRHQLPPGCKDFGDYYISMKIP